MQANCNFSEDRRYRYTLTRVWAEENLLNCVFIGLNPSTADEQKDDPTIRRCIGFAKYWGCGSLTMLNLFAIRSTDPTLLYRPEIEPIGRENDRFIIDRCLLAHYVVCAWGHHGVRGGRSKYVQRMINEAGITSFHLGLTASGEPKHPLYLRKELQPIPFISR